MSAATTLLLRRADWPERLADYIEARRHEPFAWGRNDCATFAAGAVQAMTGVHLQALMPGEWASADEAARLMQQLGGLQQALHEVLGAALVGRRAAMAGRGAVVCVPIDGRDTAGIAAGNGCWCAPGADGLVWRPMAEVRLAWEL